MALAQRLCGQKDYLANVGVMAEALRDGLSLAGAGEALSIGAATAYLATSYGNPMDLHLHTGTNKRRYLLRQFGVRTRNKILESALTPGRKQLHEPALTVAYTQKDPAVRPDSGSKKIMELQHDTHLDPGIGPDSRSKKSLNNT